MVFAIGCDCLQLKDIKCHLREEAGVKSLNPFSSALRCSHRNVSWFVPCAFATFLMINAPNASAYTRNYGSHSGYVDSTEGERGIELADMIVIHSPEEGNALLKDRIFNDTLSKEFRDQYQEKFGRTEAEQAYYSSNRFTFYEDSYGFKGGVRELTNERRKFGEYMVRRLAEWHVENYAKSDPAVHAVWEAKEKLSKMNVNVSRLKFNLAYQIASNEFDIKLDSPWLDSRLILQMNPSHFGPGHIDETTLAIGRDLTRTVRIESHYAVFDGQASLIGRKQLSSSLSTSLVASTYTQNPGIARKYDFNVNGIAVRESLFLAGVTYVF
jgi:hypothetical protein